MTMLDKIAAATEVRLALDPRYQPARTGALTVRVSKPTARKLVETAGLVPSGEIDAAGVLVILPAR